MSTKLEFEQQIAKGGEASKQACWLTAAMHFKNAERINLSLKLHDVGYWEGRANRCLEINNLINLWEDLHKEQTDHPLAPPPLSEHHAWLIWGHHVNLVTDEALCDLLQHLIKHPSYTWSEWVDRAKSIKFKFVQCLKALRMETDEEFQQFLDNCKNDPLAAADQSTL